MFIHRWADQDRYRDPRLLDLRLHENGRPYVRGVMFDGADLWRSVVDLDGGSYRLWNHISLNVTKSIILIRVSQSILPEKRLRVWNNAEHTSISGECSI